MHYRPNIVIHYKKNKILSDNMVSSNHFRFYVFFSGQFMSAFANLENCSTSNISNPFNSTSVNWGNGLNGMQQQSQQVQPFANPFKDTSKMNGFSPSFQPLFPMASVGGVNGPNPWTPNPFKVSTDVYPASSYFFDIILLTAPVSLDITVH